MGAQGDSILCIQHNTLCLPFLLKETPLLLFVYGIAHSKNSLRFIIVSFLFVFALDTRHGKGVKKFFDFFDFCGTFRLFNTSVLVSFFILLTGCLFIWKGTTHFSLKPSTF
ncbi:hypothetical protein BJ742DRAFT_580664 [Cladochytrium replicatum]|nr:hypothetical protein BJ742DRAFT_580664 [Cladochytrium replicatum]